MRLMLGLWTTFMILATYGLENPNSTIFEKKVQQNYKTYKV